MPRLEKNISTVPTWDDADRFEVAVPGDATFDRAPTRDASLGVVLQGGSPECGAQLLVAHVGACCSLATRASRDYRPGWSSQVYRSSGQLMMGRIAFRFTYRFKQALEIDGAQSLMAVLERVAGGTSRERGYMGVWLARGVDAAADVLDAVEDGVALG